MRAAVPRTSRFVGPARLGSALSGRRRRHHGAGSPGGTASSALGHPTTLQVTPGTSVAGASGVAVTGDVDTCVWVTVTVGVCAVTVWVSVG